MNNYNNLLILIKAKQQDILTLQQNVESHKLSIRQFFAKDVAKYNFILVPALLIVLGLAEKKLIKKKGLNSFFQNLFAIGMTQVQRYLLK